MDCLGYRAGINACCEGEELPCFRDPSWPTALGDLMYMTSWLALYIAEAHCHKSWCFQPTTMPCGDAPLQCRVHELVRTPWCMPQSAVQASADPDAFRTMCTKLSAPCYMVYWGSAMKKRTLWYLLAL